MCYLHIGLVTFQDITQAKYVSNDLVAMKGMQHLFLSNFSSSLLISSLHIDVGQACVASDVIKQGQ